MRAFAAFAILLCCALTANGEGRSWTDTSGKFHVVADLADVYNGPAYLKESNGLPLAKLDPADRELALNSYPAPGDPGQIDGRLAADLPQCGRCCARWLFRTQIRSSHIAPLRTRLRRNTRKSVASCTNLFFSQDGKEITVARFV